MLVPVALGQVRFTMPGLGANAQGVASGREMALRFATMDRLVGFLRLLSGATDLDASWSEMRLLLARSPLGLREMLVILPVSSIEAADIVAQAGRTAGGQCATGTGRHFVEYRNRRAPLGYDVPAVAREPADFVFYGADQVLGLQTEGERSLLRLLLGLDLVRVPRGASQQNDQPLACTLTARRALGMPLCQGLVQAGVTAKAALCEPQEKSAFGLTTAFWLFRIENLPARLLGLVGETPGLNLFLPVTDGVAVAAGYRHPVNLAACRGLFPDHHLVLLSPRPASPVLLDPAPRLADIAQLVPLPQVLANEQSAIPLQVTRPASLRLPLRLVRVPSASARLKAAYVTGNQVSWLRRLCQALPASALRNHQVVRLEEGILLLASDELAPLPFGQLLSEAAPGVLVPAGMGLQPAVDDPAMAQALGTGAESLLVFTDAQAKPLRIPTALLRPLGQEILAELSLEERAVSASPPAVDPWSGSLEVAPDPLGPFPLWGLQRK
jgi:hypothetical protein